MIIRQWTWTRNVDVEFETSAASESWCGWFGDRVAKFRILCGLSSDLAMSTLQLAIMPVFESYMVKLDHHDDPAG